MCIRDSRHTLQARVGGGERQRQHLCPPIAKIDGAWNRSVQPKTAGVHAQSHASGWTGCMDDFKAKSRLISGRQKARQTRRDDDRIAHENVGLCGADGRLGPDHSHKLYGAVETRKIECGSRIAIRSDGNRAAEVSDELFGRGWRVEPGCDAAIAAGPHEA